MTSQSGNGNDALDLAGDGSGGEEDENDTGLPDVMEVMKAKEKDPMMFVSRFEGDDDGIVSSDKPDEPGEKLLQASEGGNVEKAKSLLEENAGLITYKDGDGYTALHRACYEDNLQVATLLLSEGAEIDATSKGGWTPLHSACHWNAFRCVRLLLENGANINARTNGGLTPLLCACSGNVNTRETLIILLNEPGLDVDAKSNIDESAEDLAKRNGNLHYLFEMFRKSTRKI